MSAVRLTVFRWRRDLLSAAVLYFAWRVEEFERIERDRQHAADWRGETERSRGDAVSL